MPRKRWSAEELAELATLKPYARGAVQAFSLRWDRRKSAVSSKLQKLRTRGQAEDVPHARRAEFPVHRFD